MAGKLGLKRSLAAFFLGLGLAGAASAQHPFLGPGYPAQDPRSASPIGGHASVSHAIEYDDRLGPEICALRARGLREPGRAITVDEWALGVEHHAGKKTLFFEVRVIDATGTALAIERPTLYMFGSGPTYDWRPGQSSREGYVRIEKNLKETSKSERVGFITAVEEQGVRELAVTLPDGRGDAYGTLYDGATPRQHEFFVACVCKILGIDWNDLFSCP